MFKKTTIAAMMAAGLVASSASMAQGMMKGGPDSGFNAGISIGQSSADCSVTGGSCDDKDTAYRIFGGYQFNRNLGAEIGYSQLGEVSASFPGVGNVTTKATAWDVVGVGTYPINQQFSVYGKLGFYNAEAKVSGLVSGKKTTTDLTYGLGAQYNFSRNLGLRGEWQRYGGIKSPEATGGGVTISGDSDVDVLSLGVVYKF